jgi:hypothetical protein
VYFLVTFCAQFSVISVVSSPTIGMPLLVVSIRLIDRLIFSTLRTFAILLIEFLLFLWFVPEAFWITLIWRNRTFPRTRLWQPVTLVGSLTGGC